MVYPCSAEVSDGMPTSCQHYNHLRSDALYFGNTLSEAVPAGDLLARYQSGVRLEWYSTTQVCLPASPAEPVLLVIEGFALRQTSTLFVSGSGAAGRYTVFARRTAGSHDFSLQAALDVQEYPGLRRLGSFYWDGSRIVRASIQNEAAQAFGGLLGLEASQSCDGRLSLVSGNPCPAGDNAGSVLYWTPYSGGRLGLYVPGGGWQSYFFGELSINLGGCSADTNYDVFALDQQGVLGLELAAWAGPNARSAALTRQDGVLVKSGEPFKRYLGSVRTREAGLVRDEVGRRMVWNYYHRQPRPLRTASAASHIYAASAVRAWNNDASQRVEWLVGVVEGPLQLCLQGAFKLSSNGSQAVLGLGINASTLNCDARLQSANDQEITSCAWELAGWPLVGYNSAVCLESVPGGINANYLNYVLSGIVAG
jgi:hypothetical protein